jgi:hypothetical protein
MTGVQQAFRSARYSTTVRWTARPQRRFTETCSCGPTQNLHVSNSFVLEACWVRAEMTLLRPRLFEAHEYSRVGAAWKADFWVQSWYGSQVSGSIKYFIDSTVVLAFGRGWVTCRYLILDVKNGTVWERKPCMSVKLYKSKKFSFAGSSFHTHTTGGFAIIVWLLAVFTLFSCNHLRSSLVGLYEVNVCYVLHVAAWTACMHHMITCTQPILTW